MIQIDKNWQINILPGSYYKAPEDNLNFYTENTDYTAFVFEDKDKVKEKTVFLCRYDSCHKSFLSIYKFFDHLRSHTKEKPFKCEHPGCDHAYSQMGNYKVHLSKH